MSFRRLACLALAAAMVFSSVPYASAAVAATSAEGPAPLTAADILTTLPSDARSAGADRIETALAVSKLNERPFDAVVIATSGNFPDALAGAPLAYAANAPILLTGSRLLDTRVRTRLLEIRAAGARTAYLLGSEGALSADVERDVASVFGRDGIVRIGGASRYETAAKIAETLRALRPVTGAVLASGDSYPDALSVSGWAAFSGQPILLAKRDSIPAATRDALSALGSEDDTAPAGILVVGGAAAIAQATVAGYANVTRLGGADRYETSALIAEHAWEWGMPSASLGLATGRNFPDAVAAGPWCAANGAPLLLVAPDSLPAPAKAFITQHSSTVKRLRAFGGTVAVGAGVVRAAADAGVVMSSKRAPVASAETNGLLSRVTTDSLTFSDINEQLGELQAGWVLRSDPTPTAPDGYFRRILGIDRHLDGSVTYETTTAAITDVILKGSIDAVLPVGQGGAATTPVAVRRSRVGPASTDGSVGFDSTVKLAFGPTFVFEKDGQKVTFSANGNLEFEQSLVISIVIDGRWRTGPFGVQYWEAYVDRYDQFLTYKGSFSLTAAVTGKVDKLDLDIGPPIPVAADPLITGLLVAPEVQLKLKATIGVEFSASYAVTISETKAGVRYRDGTGWESFEERPVSPPDPRFHPGSKVSGSVKIGIGAKVAVKLGKIAGPYLDVTLLFGKASLSYDLVTPAFSAEIEAGLSVGGGLEAGVPIMGLELAKFELFEQEIVLFSKTIAFPLATPPPASQPPWPMFGHDAQHTHRSPVIGPETNRVDWSLTVGEIVHTGPSVGADGTVYVNSWDGVLSATYPDGAPKPPYKAGFQSFSTPAIGSDGTLYFGSGDGKVYAVDPNGTLKWAYQTGGWPASSPVIGADGTVYIGCYDHKLYALRSNGMLKWAFETGAEAMSPALAPDGTVYVGSADGKLYAVDVDGSVKWSYQTGGVIYSSPAVASDGTVYIGSSDHNLYALKPDGSLRWAYQTGDVVYSSPAIGWAGTVYVGSWDGKVYAISPTGELEWSYPTGARIYSSTSVDGNGTVYVGSDDHKLYAIRASGSLKWSALLDAAVESPPALGADGTIYVGTSAGKLFAIGP